MVAEAGGNRTLSSLGQDFGSQTAALQGSCRMSDHRMTFPGDFDDYAWEVEAKGWFSGAILSVAGKDYTLNFYDPVRLGQAIQGELQRGSAFCEPNLVVVKAVTRSEMEGAAREIVKSGQVSSLLVE
jgi:hypothetical protein